MFSKKSNIKENLSFHLLFKLCTMYAPKIAILTRLVVVPQIRGNQ